MANTDDISRARAAEGRMSGVTGPWLYMMKLGGILLIALILQIPVSTIGNLIGERQQRRADAVEEVAGKWGHAQAVAGPVLLVPYRKHVDITDAEGRVSSRTEERRLVLMPSRLLARGHIESENRHRGIFTIPLYQARMDFEGEFVPPDLRELGIDSESVSWDRAVMAVGISDIHAVQSADQVSWNGKALPFRSGGAGFDTAGVHAEVGAAGGAGHFAFTLVLKGSQDYVLAPLGDRTSVELSGNSPNPSFQGAWLPVRHEIGPAGFNAVWELNGLGRNYPQAWTVAAGAAAAPAVADSRFGVTLTVPVDAYRMADRSIKYASLFILLTFGAVWLLEVVGGLPVHLVQYLLLGAGLCMFYLLELSLAEHTGFAAAYLTAACAVVVMTAGYARSVLRRWGRALGVAAGVSALYGYLYVLLVNEDDALVMGAVGLFLALGAVMFATRRVNWYGKRGGGAEAAAA